MRHISPLLVLLGLIGAASPASAIMTVERYLAIAGGEVEGVPPATVLPYLMGTLDAAMLMADLAAAEGAPIFCMPDDADVDIEIGDFQFALDSMLDELAVTLDNFDELAAERSVGLAAVQLLIEVYPCGDPR